MKFPITTLVLLALAVNLAASANWAVLVAGSNGFWNYRHQSDICHAYNLLLDNGFNPKKIIMMLYDDIASDFQNPIPGKVYNHPDQSGPGVDVYARCKDKINYRGKDVTPENFMNVLTGKWWKLLRTGGKGKSLRSGRRDRVFINFVDHGAPGVIIFPNSELYADQLNATFTQMIKKKKFKEMVFYLETCESGSMFTDLPTTSQIYGVSAANPEESSYATYCYPYDVVNGTHVNACLGDLFSVNWMEDGDTGFELTETLETQFLKVREETEMSHVMQWGDLSVAKEPIGNFLGPRVGSLNWFKTTFKTLMRKTKLSKNLQEKKDSVSLARSAQINFLTNQYKLNPSEENFFALQKEINSISYFNSQINIIAEEFSLDGVYDTKQSTDFECYRPAIQTFKEQCGSIPENGWGSLKYLYQFCQLPKSDRKGDLIQLIQQIC